jgi:hypothetical protein
MATIKLKTSGAVVLKNGKVACGCCAQAGCCMYPAQGLVDGLYSVDDLPDQVQIGGYILQKGGETPAVFPVQVDGAFYATLSDEEAYIYLDNFYWNFGPAVGAGAQECLVDGNIVQDQFADSYTLTINGGGSAVVTRQSLCQWTAETNDEEGTLVTWELVYLSLNDPENPNNYKWLISVQGLTTFGGIKNDPQNSPVGDYFAASIFYVASVS